ncbi:hypothetical protein HK101_011818 [Irineochytrium annulatum]|nr:hypothetical protein HK101_011818 [Irineochytrium annulatum]
MFTQQLLARAIRAATPPRSRLLAPARRPIQSWARQIQDLQTCEYDTVDARQITLLDLTLNPKRDPSDRLNLCSEGQPLPPVWHLVLFPPRIPEGDLAPDGYDQDLAPPEPFRKRMWAGGSFEWIKGNELRIGQRVEQKLTVEKVEEKKGARGDMVLVWQKREVSNEKGLAVAERRCLAYMKLDFPSGETSAKRAGKGGAREPDFGTCVVPSPITLFRYSALTFNSHFIHLDKAYTRDFEGYPDRLVHGPLTCTYLAGLAHEHTPPGKYMSRLEYRAVAPIIVDTPINLMARMLEKATSGALTPSVDGKDGMDLWACTDDTIAMKASVTLESK